MGLRVAVIGTGTMGRNHARIYSEITEAELVAVCDMDAQSAAHTARTHRVRAYTGHRELLAREHPEIVSVAVPTEDHCEVALDALEAGCDVLVEKPLTATTEQGRRLIGRAAELGRRLMVGHVVRFDSAVQELKRMLDRGDLGRIFEVRCRRLGPFPARVRDVGVVVDLATHDLDLMSFLTGQSIARVYAETERQIHTAHEDLLAGTVRLAGGAIGLLDINWLTPTKIRELMVTGEKGMFLVDHLTQDLFFYENQDAVVVEWDQMRILRGVSEGRMIRFPVSKQEPLKAELQAFVQSVASGSPVPVPGESGLAALQAALALVQSGLEHRPIDLAS